MPAKPKRRAAKPKTITVEPTDDDSTEIVEVPGYGTLTARQKRFAEQYRLHGNATRAAREAGYNGASDDAMGDIGYQLLRNVKVRWYIAYLGRDDDLQAGDILDMLKAEATTADHAGARVRAQELLGKARGMFGDFENAPNRLSDEALVAILAGDDSALGRALLAKLKGG